MWPESDRLASSAPGTRSFSLPLASFSLLSLLPPELRSSFYGILFRLSFAFVLSYSPVHYMPTYEYTYIRIAWYVYLTYARARTHVQGHGCSRLRTCARIDARTLGGGRAVNEILSERTHTKSPLPSKQNAIMISRV